MIDVAGERDRPTSDRERMLDVVGLAARLGVTERFVRRMVHERRIPFYKVGSLVRFDVVDVEQWLATNRVVPMHPHRAR
jgi:excisionase family DNA binding protein